MAAWTGNIVGMGGEGKYPAADGQRKFREPLNPDLYDEYYLKTAQAEGLICKVWILKDVTVTASDTFTLTVKAA